MVYVVLMFLVVCAVVKVGFGVMVRLVEMMSLDLCVLSGVDGLLLLFDIEYLLCYDLFSNNELV